MSDKPVFLYAAVYDEIADAEADYEVVSGLRSTEAIGTFDSAVIQKGAEGKVRVTKTDKPKEKLTRHVAWTGAGVGALIASILGPAVLGSAIVAVGAGGLATHRSRGISRWDLKELGHELETGSAAVIVLSESRLEDQFERAVRRANR
jgi:uncharacterized membrane protein